MPGLQVCFTSAYFLGANLVSSRDLPSSPRTTRRLRLFPRETQASFPGFIMDTLSDKCMPMFTFTYNIESRTQHSLTHSLARRLPPRVLHTAETPHRWDVTYWLNTREDAHRSARSNGWSRMTCTFTEACSLTFSPLTGDSWLWMPKGELMLLNGKERRKKIHYTLAKLSSFIFPHRSKHHFDLSHEESHATRLAAPFNTHLAQTC